MEMRQGKGIVHPWLRSLATLKQHGVRFSENVTAALHFLVRCRSMPTSRILKKGRLGIAVGIGEIMEYGLEKILGLTGGVYFDAERWYRRHKPTGRRLSSYRTRNWPAEAPQFTIVLRLGGTPPRWLRETLASVKAQTYSRYQLIVAVDRPLPADNQGLLAGLEVVEAAELERDGTRLRGDFVCFLDDGDCLEPHALHRFAEAVLRDRPDLLYSDLANTGANIRTVRSIQAQPAFSYDHYLSSAYFTHLIAVRASLVRAAGGLRDSACRGSDVDLVLRVLERSRTVTHVADILYRRRPQPQLATKAAGKSAAELDAVQRHLTRLGTAATVQPTDDSHCRAVTYPLQRPARVAIIIPTKNKVELLRQCLDSLAATVPAGLADICVVDHQSDEPATQAYLRGLPPTIRVLPYQGPFNFSAINNHAVAHLRDATHYLFLNNDTEALQPGWLEHMVGLAQRPDVGAVGALLLYGDRKVQHAGVQVGMHYAADHAPKGMPAYGANGQRLAGPQGTLLTVRDQSAVTAACVLVSADAFHQVGQFDERLVVGFGDIDLCLRLRAQGYRVLIDPQAVLLHHESASRGQCQLDPHPLDSIRFRDRYWDLILQGDPFHSPLHSRYAAFQLKACIWNRHRLVARTQAVELNHAAAERKSAA